MRSWSTWPVAWPHGFGDEPKQDVVRVRVLPVRAGREPRRMHQSEREELAGRPDATGVAEDCVPKSLVGGVVEQPAGVVHQLAQADRGAVRDEAGEPLLDRVVDVELSFRFELEHDDRDERLRHARDPVVVGCAHRHVRADVGEAGDAAAGRRRRTHVHDGAGAPDLTSVRARSERFSRFGFAACAGTAATASARTARARARTQTSYASRRELLHRPRGRLRQLHGPLLGPAGAADGRPRRRAAGTACRRRRLRPGRADRRARAAVARTSRPSTRRRSSSPPRASGIRAADVREAGAEELPYADDEFDAALAQLVVHFMADPNRGLREMARVTRADGVVAACVWDFAGGRSPL